MALLFRGGGPCESLSHYRPLHRGLRKDLDYATRRGGRGSVNAVRTSVPCGERMTKVGGGGVRFHLECPKRRARRGPGYRQGQGWMLALEMHRS